MAIAAATVSFLADKSEQSLIKTLKELEIAKALNKKTDKMYADIQKLGQKLIKK